LIHPHREAKKMNVARFRAWSFAGLVLMASTVGSVAAGAQSRSFVSVTGSDAANCQRATPCRTFSAAIRLTSAGGEVIALDSGGYGATGVNRSMSLIAAPGVHAAITVTTGSGVEVTGAATDRVVLRGLDISTSGNTTTAIDVIGPVSVSVEKCVLQQIGDPMFSNGIRAYSVPARISVSDSVLRGYFYAFMISAFAPSRGQVMLNRVEFSDNVNSVFLVGDLDTTIRDVVVHRGGNGISVLTNAIVPPVATVSIERTTIANGWYGLFVDGVNGGAEVVLSDSTIVGNANSGYMITPGSLPTAKILSRGNNTVYGNGPNQGTLTPLPNT